MSFSIPSNLLFSPSFVTVLMWSALCLHPPRTQQNRVSPTAHWNSPLFHSSTHPSMSPPLHLPPFVNPPLWPPHDEIVPDLTAPFHRMTVCLQGVDRALDKYQLLIDSSASCWEFWLLLLTLWSLEFWTKPRTHMGLITLQIPHQESQQSTINIPLFCTVFHFRFISAIILVNTIWFQLRFGLYACGGQMWFCSSLVLTFGQLQTLWFYQFVFCCSCCSSSFLRLLQTSVIFTTGIRNTNHVTP